MIILLRFAHEPDSHLPRIPAPRKAAIGDVLGPQLTEIVEKTPPQTREGRVQFAHLAGRGSRRRRRLRVHMTSPGESGCQRVGPRPTLSIQLLGAMGARGSCTEGAVEPVQLAVQIRKAASRSAQAFAAYVVALDCARLYSPQQLFELKRLRYEADARLIALEALQEPAAAD
jgi:hypothetical protein